ncbi:MAG: hypothetical protein G01um101413_862, partial [Parcubacteria group bacterium Gr01-1014_13]
ANDLDLNFNSIINVATIIGKDNKWRIDEDGNLIQKIATEKGDKEIYGLQSSGKQEIVISGTSTLENGTKKVILAELDQAIIDTTVPLKIFFNMSGETKGVYIAERSYDSFVLKENDNGQSNAEFDWTVMAKILSPATNAGQADSAPATADAGVVEDIVVDISVGNSQDTTSTIETSTTTPLVTTVEPDASTTTVDVVDSSSDSSSSTLVTP